MDHQIERLYQQYSSSNYPPFTPSQVKKLYRKYVHPHQQSILDAFTTMLATQQLLLSDQIDYDKITPQMKEAWQLAYPNVPIENLSSYDAEQIQGLVNGWKGKYFEVIIRDKLNAGELVGGIQLENGQTAQLAESATQPGWDLQITDTNGNIVEELQLKATHSLSYIKHSLDKYPDFDVITTNEAVDGTTGLLDQIHDSGVSDSGLEVRFLTLFENVNDSPIQNVMENVFSGLGLLAIAATESYMVVFGKKSAIEAFKSGTERSVKSLLSTGAGALVMMGGATALVLPVTFATRLVLDRFQIEHKLCKQIEHNIIALKPLEMKYKR